MAAVAAPVLPKQGRGKQCYMALHRGSVSFTEIETVKLARSVFSKLHEICCSWVKDFPLRRRPQIYYETSIHAIKNMRRKMEDKHVCIPDFNMLFNLEVKGILGAGATWSVTRRTEGGGLHYKIELFCYFE